MMKLEEKYKPSKPCSCDICKSYCKRPGWWTVEEAAKAIQAGLVNRMMLEVSPQYDFGILAPAFKGNEVNYAMQVNAENGCTFYGNGLCELFETGLEPLECRFTHHNRKGAGIKCHQALAKDWKSKEGQKLVIQWCRMVGFWQRLGINIH